MTDPNPVRYCTCGHAEQHHHNQTCYRRDQFRRPCICDGFSPNVTRQARPTEPALHVEYDTGSVGSPTGQRSAAGGGVRQTNNNEGDT